ncbi:MAG: GNAT family N-acetyltransferase [Candidatus Hodarchaeota archaeon]
MAKNQSKKSRERNIMRIKPLDETIERSSMIEVWKQMWSYLTPEGPILSEEAFDAIVVRDDQTVLSRDFLIAEDSQGSIIGFIGLQKSSTRDFWRITYAVLPEYIKSRLPGRLMDAIVNLAKKQGSSKLRSYSRMDFTSLNRKLEELGIKPVQYGWWMRLDDFGALPQSVVPPGITLRKEKDINDFIEYVAVYNEAHKEAFEFEPYTAEKLKQIFDQTRKISDIEHLFAFEGNKLVGICYITINPEKKVMGTINALGVLLSYRFRGIGSALLASGIRSLHEKECKMIELSVMANNEQALALYKKFGFYELPLRTQYIYEVHPSEYSEKLLGVERYNKTAR